MKKGLFFLLMMMAYAAQSQQVARQTITGTRSVEPFTEINVSGPLSVEIIHGDAQQVAIEAEVGVDASGIGAEVKKGVLHIQVNKGNYQDKYVVIHVTVTSLKSIKAKTGAKVRIPEPVSMNGALEASVQAGGYIWMKAGHKLLTVSVNQGGNITLFGETEMLSASIVTGGTIAGYHCKAKTVEASVKAGGDLFCQPIEILNAKITAGGSIFYYGKPATLNDKVQLGGKLIQIDALPEFREDF
jgi:hypothetical protein